MKTTSKEERYIVFLFVYVDIFDFLRKSIDSVDGIQNFYYFSLKYFSIDKNADLVKDELRSRKLLLVCVIIKICSLVFIIIHPN